ncbi:MAG: tRNA (guanosine(46)-N7)-methyltransferase TrmB [Flavobacteriales bacterium]
MAKKKLFRFAQNKEFQNVVDPDREEIVQGLFSLKGNWNKNFFKNKNPIVLELGCGKGEYSIGLAKKFPEKNFIGIDIKGARFWFGAKEALENGIQNVGFLRSKIELVDQLFAKNEISEIWITFPDPQIKYRRAKHRLTHPVFLKRYHYILNAEGSIHLKTDSEYLHGYTHGIIYAQGHKVLVSSHDVYHFSNTHLHIPTYVKEIQTYYESKYLKEGKAITYLNFKLNY